VRTNVSRISAIDGDDLIDLEWRKALYSAGSVRRRNPGRKDGTLLC
jgi:hypothetical protein